MRSFESFERFVSKKSTVSSPVFAFSFFAASLTQKTLRTQSVAFERDERRAVIIFEIIMNGKKAPQKAAGVTDIQKGNAFYSQHLKTHSTTDFLLSIETNQSKLM